MQKFLVVAAIGATLSLTALSASAQHNYVKERPHENVAKRPNRPDAHHVWVGTEWHFNNGRYEQVQGHWDAPPHGRHNWVAGHWTKERRGSYWVPGHWS
ncbi:hypothetical protein [Puia sp.]|jgi:hypothetical protein|uniref:hypothetical protein n=1 Tax=Puia sp. TaxID=2045100 RepID=UPI002F421212